MCRNSKLLGKLDADGSGEVDEGEFVLYFDEVLPQEEGEFAAAVGHFLEAAHDSHDAGIEQLQEQSQQAVTLQPSTPVAGPSQVGASSSAFKLSHDDAVWL